MAYALAALSDVQKRVIQILNANQTAFATTVSGTVGAFPYDEEIELAIFEADEQVCTEGYFQSGNTALASPFDAVSSPLGYGDSVPFYKGTINKAEVSTNTETFTAGASNVLTTGTAHGWSTGQLLSAITNNTLPTGIAALTNYYAIVLTTTTLKLATSLTNAIDGTAVAVTNGSGSGINTLISWKLAVEAKNLDDITNAVQVTESYVGSGAFDFLYKENGGSIYSTALYTRITYPEYIRTSDLQSRQSEEFLVVCGAVRKLVKNASPAPFQAYIDESIRGLGQLVLDGQYTLTADKIAGGELIAKQPTR